MKKLSLILSVATLFALASCKKSYTCNCVTTETDNSKKPPETQTYNNQSSTYSQKMTEKQAKAACAHEQQQLEATYDRMATDNGTTAKDPSLVVTVNCTLK